MGRKKIIISIMTVAVLFGMIRLPVSKMMETQILKSDIHYQTHIVNANSLAVENMTVHTEHNWDEGTVTKAATCAGNGTILYKCIECGIERNEIIPATGEHKWDRGVITRLSTCTRKGIRTLTCKVCGETMEKKISKNPQNHTATEVRDAVEVSSFTDGYTGDTYCTACGALVSEGEIIPATGEKDKIVNYRALLIGETGYSTRLNGPENDIACMNALLSGISNHFEVYTQQDASMDEIIDLVDIAFEDATEDDVSLFYYSGHGVTNSGEHYSGALQTVDYRYITTFDLAEMLSGIPGKVIVILDSCGSGATIYDGDGDENDKGMDDSEDPYSVKGVEEVIDFDPEVFNDDVMEAFDCFDPGLSVTSDISAKPGMLRSGELRQSKFSVITSSSYEQNSQTTYLDGIWGGALTRGIAEAAGCIYPGGDYFGNMPADYDENSRVSFMELADYCIEYTTGRQNAMSYYGSGDTDLFIRE